MDQLVFLDLNEKFRQLKNIAKQAKSLAKKSSPFSEEVAFVYIAEQTAQCAEYNVREMRTMYNM